MVIHFIGNISTKYGRGKDKKKRKSILPYLFPAAVGGVASLGGKNC